MISSAFLGIPTGAMKILLNITPIEEFLLAKAVRESNRIIVIGLWYVNPVGSFGKTRAMLMFAMRKKILTSAANAS